MGQEKKQKGKLRNFLHKYKRQVRNIALLLGVAILISFAFLGILLLAGVIQYSPETGFWISSLGFQQIKDKWYTWIIFLGLQIIATTLLCFVPGTSMMFITLGVAIFGTTWQCFLICFSGVILSSVTMDLIGRFGGTKLIKKLVGEQEYESALKVVQEKGIVYVPVMYCLPLFPDDAICMICGTMKMKFWLHLIYIILCRGIGGATIVFGLNLIPYKSFTTFYDWFVCVAVIIVYVLILLYIARKIDKWLTKKMSEKKENDNEQE